MRSAVPFLCLVALLPTPGLAQRDLALEDELAWAGLVPEDLVAAYRDTVNRRRQSPADPWRVAANQHLLAESPLRAAQWGQELADALGTAGGGPLAGTSWATFFDLASEELQLSDRDPIPCVPAAAPPATLVERSVAHEADTGIRRGKREVRDLTDSIDPRLNAAIGTLMGAATVAQCQLDVAFAELDEERRGVVVAAVERALGGIAPGTAEAEEVVAVLAPAWEETGRAALVVAGAGWSAAVTAAALELSSLPPEAWPQQPTIFPTGFGEVWIGSPASNSGTGDPFLIVDPGGDDQWRVSPDAEALPAGGARAVRGWIDLGGDDLWQTGDGGVGGALFGVAAGIDLGGDDTWRAGRLTAGAAAFGTSTWLDLGGRDIYDGGAAAQGFALFGVAGLRDLGDDADTYRSPGPAQGAALPAGVALLHDVGGGDTMEVGAGGGQALSGGWFPLIGGGLGVLLDESGDDRRTTEASGQGACVGGGAAAALDLAGDDVWTSTGSVAQAAALDECVAVLLDRRGNDRYTASGEAQGWADRRGSATLHDLGGDDRYAVGTSGQGFASGLGVALLRDGAGRDAYTAGPASSDDGVRLGVRIDDTGDAPAVASPGGLGERAEGTAYGSKPPGTEAEAIALVRDGTSGAAEAGSALVKAGPGFASALLARVSPRRPAETAVLDYYFSAGAGARTPTERATLVATIADDASARERDEADGSARWHLRWLAGLAAADLATLEVALKVAGSMLDHPHPLVRAAAFDVYTVVAEVPDLAIADQDRTAWESRAAVALQADGSPEVRWAALGLLREVGGAGVASIVAGSLKTGDAPTRGAAVLALAAIAERTDGLAVARALFPLTEAEARPVREQALRLIGLTGHREAWEVLEPALADADPRIRRAAILGARPLLPDRAVEAALRARLDLEDEPRVAALLPAPEE